MAKVLAIQMQRMTEPIQKSCVKLGTVVDSASFGQAVFAKTK